MPRRLLALPLLVALLALAPGLAAARGHVGACSSAHVAVSHATIAKAQDATLCLLNRIRARAGLRPLRMNRRLAAVASRHAADMVRRHYFAHDTPSGVSPFTRILRAHYVPAHASWSLGENIAWGTASLAEPAAIVRAWMDSPPHRANILSRQFREIGIGVAIGVPLRGARFAGATYTTDFGSHS